MMKKPSRTLFICCLVLGFFGCGSETQNASPVDPSAQLSSPAVASSSANPNSFQIVREGQSLPLQNLLGAHVGEEIPLSVLGASGDIYWVTMDPFAGYFVSPGRLRLRAPGRFYIAALSANQSDYVAVEVLESPPSPAEAPASSTPASGSTPPTPESSPAPVCVATTCEHEAKNCGEISDGCGGTLQCGVCSNPGETCGGASVPNVCGLSPPPPPATPSRPASLPSDPFIDEVISFTPGPGGSTDTTENRARVLGPPRGCGLSCGSTDVLSLGVRGEIILRSATPILNGEGVDFIVFENPFFAGGNPMGLLFAELGEVAVSQNGSDFIPFPCDSANRSMLYPGCAGAHPVFANADTNTILPTDYRVSGGDGFDLQDLGLDWIQYIRIRDLDTVGGSGFDLDAISIVHQ
ncbi:MAG: hypothetical protein HQM15_09245 [Deltaproteobacteria bacterium]|nr:hypothetical protein [Deltaproteobacteria bacterium]